MNPTEVANLALKHVRIRPIPLRFHTDNRMLASQDDPWLVLNIGSFAIIIENVTTRHKLELHPKQILEFSQDATHSKLGVLTLDGQVWICGDNIGLDPIQPESTSGAGT